MKKKLKVALTALVTVATVMVPVMRGVTTTKGAARNDFAPTPVNVSVSTATDVTFTWTASTAVEASPTTFTFTVSPALPSALANCTAADTQADTTSGGTGSFGSFTTSSAVFTTSNATTTTGRSLCLKFPSIATPASYSVSFASSSTNQDFGVALVYVGGDNVVNVKAGVSPTLSFNIRDLGDTADLTNNVCDLGTITTSSNPNNDGTVTSNAECGYSLAVGTNADGGFTLNYSAGAAMTNGATPIAATTEDQAISAGAEAYGFVYISPAATGKTSGSVYTTPINTGTAAASEDEDDNTGFTPIKTTSTPLFSYPDSILYTAAGGATDVSKVIHGMTVSSGTAAGSYTQTVTYTVSGTF